MVNYIGHGSETSLGGERYFELPDIDQLSNKGKYALFSIMTCDFTRFDNPTLESGGERLFLRENAGAIGILADRKSTRLNSSHVRISYAVFCLKKKIKNKTQNHQHKYDTDC